MESAEKLKKNTHVFGTTSEPAISRCRERPTADEERLVTTHLWFWFPLAVTEVYRRPIVRSLMREEDELSTETTPRYKKPAVVFDKLSIQDGG